MKTLIQIPDLPNIYAVKVPTDAVEFDEEMHKPIGCDTWRIGYKTERGGNYSMYTESKDNLKILGYVTKSEISFDALDVVEKFTNPHNERQFANYKKQISSFDRYSFWNANDSFRSALPEEIVWDNEFEEHPELVGNPKEYDNERFEIDYKQWKSAQSNITEKLLILQKL